MGAFHTPPQSSQQQQGRGAGSSGRLLPALAGTPGQEEKPLVPPLGPMEPAQLAAVPALISPHTLSSERASGNRRKTKQEFTKPHAARPGHRSSEPPAANAPEEGRAEHPGVGRRGLGLAAGRDTRCWDSPRWGRRAGAQGSLRSSHLFLLIRLSSDGDGDPATAWLGADSPCLLPHTRSSTHVEAPDP